MRTGSFWASDLPSTTRAPGGDAATMPGAARPTQHHGADSPAPARRAWSLVPPARPPGPGRPAAGAARGAGPAPPAPPPAPPFFPPDPPPLLPPHLPPRGPP